MATENFSTYTEVDDSNRLSVSASQALAVDVDHDIDVYLYKDFGANYFDALDVDFELYISSNCVNSGDAGPGFSNTVDDVNAWESTSVWVGGQGNGTYSIMLLRDGAASDSYTCSANTLYYCTLVRAAGNNSISCLVYSNSARTTLLDTLTVVGFGTAKWRYCYGFANRNIGTAGQDFDGYVQNLDLGPPPIVAPTVTTQAVSSIATTTATGNGNITATGGENASAWGTCLSTSANPTTADTVDAGSGAGGTGAFTTSIDSLTAGTLYHVRAYATNSAGTSYGADVDFTTKTIYEESCTDGLSMGDSNTGSLTLDLSLTDGLASGDSPERDYEANPAITDGISLGDTPVTQAVLNVLASDGLTFGDTPITQAVLNALSSDGVVLGDTPLTQAVLNALASDGLVAGDTPTTQAILNALATDGIKLGDLASIYKIINLLLTDGIKLGDITMYYRKSILRLVDFTGRTLVEFTGRNLNDNTGEFRELE